MNKYWQNAVTFDEYIKETERRIEVQNLEDTYNEYYELGLQRMNRTLKVFKKNEADLEKLKSKNFNGKILIISEPWCGDASATVPVLAKFFEDENEVKIFYRDSDTSLIESFLTNGAQAIPKVLILDENMEVKNVWGPRPKYGNDLLKKFKENQEDYPREEFYNDLQVYYAKNRGKDVIDEVLELL